jgi:terpene synthase-like protein
MTGVVFEPITVPPFYCPVPAGSAGDAEDLSAGTLAWLDRTGADLDERRAYLAGTDIALSASLTIPDGPTERRQVYADLLFWLYAFDDAVVDESTGALSAESNSLLLRLTRLLETPEAAEPGPWLVSALSELLDRLAAFAGPEQTRRCAEHLRAYVLSVALSMARRDAEITPSLNDYVISRLAEGAVQVVTTMIPIVGDYQLTGLVDRRVVALEEMVNFLTNWDNDIVGYNKETYRSLRYGYPAAPSGLPLLARELGCSIEAAIGPAVAYRDRVMCLLLRRGAEVAASAPAPLARYVAGLGRWVRGYLEWAMVTTRFADPRNPTDTTPVDRFSVPATWAATPTDDSDEPLPIPSIAWWWH